MDTETTFDLDTLRRGIEERDAEAMLSLYADDAEMTEVDKTNPPRAPASSAAGRRSPSTCGMSAAGT